MNSKQKLIKYCALALALIIIISIAGTAVSLFGIIISVFDTDDTVLKDLNELEITDVQDIRSLKIDIRAASLEIKSGENFKIETNNKYIKCSSNGGRLEIFERNHAKIKMVKSGVVLYIPKDFKFENVKITSGAGGINIDSLLTEDLTFELGAGEVIIKNIAVSGEADIDGGAGNFEIHAGSMCDLDLDIGMGHTALTLSLKGKNEINMGVGELDLTLLGEKDDYSIEVNKGIGAVSIDGKNMHDGDVYGNGDNLIEIDGGIGSINVNFK